MANCKKLSNELDGHLKYINQSRKKIEKLYNQGLIKNKDLEILYKGLFIDAYTSLELFIENLFIGLLTKSLEHSNKKVNPRVTFRSHKVCREVLSGDRSYVDWIPYRLTIRRAKGYFTNGLPFTCLSNAELKLIEQLSIVRNTIAHESKHAKKIFHNEILAGLYLSRRDSTPVGYLRSIYISAPSQSRYEKHMIDIAFIANKLTS